MRCKDCYPIQWCPCGKSLNRCKMVYHSDEYRYEVVYVNGIIVYLCETCYTREESKKKEQPPNA